MREVFEEVKPFHGIDSVEVEMSTGETFKFPIPDEWRKLWVAQLSSCKLMQVLKDAAVQRIFKPRRDRAQADPWELRIDPCQCCMPSFFQSLVLQMIA